VVKRYDGRNRMNGRIERDLAWMYWSGGGSGSYGGKEAIRRDPKKGLV